MEPFSKHYEKERKGQGREMVVYQLSVAGIQQKETCSSVPQSQMNLPELLELCL